jgi:hypothetical protein
MFGFQRNPVFSGIQFSERPFSERLVFREAGFQRGQFWGVPLYIETCVNRE